MAVILMVVLLSGLPAHSQTAAPVRIIRSVPASIAQQQGVVLPAELQAALEAQATQTAQSTSAASTTQSDSDQSDSDVPRVEREFMTLLLKATFDRSEEGIFNALTQPEIEEPEIDKSLLVEPEPEPAGSDTTSGEAQKPEAGEEPTVEESADPDDTDQDSPADNQQPDDSENSDDDTVKEVSQNQDASTPESTAATPPSPADPQVAEQQKKVDEAHAKWASWRVEKFKRAVTLSHWTVCQSAIDELTEENRILAYRHLLKGLNASPRQTPPKPVDGQPVVKLALRNHYDLSDVVQVADICPAEPELEDVRGLASLLRQVSSEHSFFKEFLKNLDEGIRWFGGEAAEKRERAAQLLIEAGRPLDSEPFLPEMSVALESGQTGLLDLLARLKEAIHARDGDKELLLDAWKINMAILTQPEPEEEPAKAIRQSALTRALDLSLRIEDETTNEWLAGLLENDVKAAREVFTAIGAQVVESRPMRNPEPRRRRLELQHRAVEILFEKAPNLTSEWKDILNLMALNWLHEATQTERYDTSVSRGPSMNFDSYGNVYYSSTPAPRNNNLPTPIQAGDILKVAPSVDWQKFVGSGVRPGFAAVLAQLHLKVKELDEAFPYIKEVCEQYPESGEQLVNSYINVWIENNDPNSDLNRRSSYMYIYGYNRRQDAIPLTRSKQERSHEDLSERVTLLKQLPVDELDESLLMRAFTVTHSVAEVYKIEDLEKVFGDISSLKASTLASLVQTMRRNLAGVWRQPQTQKTSETGRSDAELQAEIFRGYEVANEVLNRGLTRFPESWELHLARATMLFDENTYRYELTRDTQFSQRRTDAFEEFKGAEALYRQALPDLKQQDESDDPYTIWFYAALGASELAALRDFHQPAPAQIDLIRERIAALPGEAAERHIARFSNALATRMTQVKAELKHRYLQYGLQIAGDHEKAAQAAKQFEYYGDLVREIRLHAHLDGPSEVGHKEPFGLFIDIRHTKEVEREAGGFQKYLQNQNASGFYYYNYGRPNEDYRDKFETALRESLTDHFEVLSVTFHSEKIQSQGDAEEGWRKTPYAYVLMRAVGPEVDMIPPVQMDLDFNDNSGYVVLPIASAKIPINARPEKPSARVFRNLEIAQSLDERESETGMISLEVRAKAHGLIPDLEDILDLNPREFSTESIEDGGVSITQVDPNDPENAAVSERLWTVLLKPREGLNRYPTHFQFGTSKIDGAEMLFQKYEDADLAEVPSEVRIQQKYGEGTPAWAVALIFGAILAAGFIVYWLLRPRNLPEVAGPRGFDMPSEINPFTIVALLQKIRSSGMVSPDRQNDLEKDIHNLELKYFRIADVHQPDPAELRHLAETWIQNAAA